MYIEQDQDEKARHLYTSEDKMKYLGTFEVVEDGYYVFYPADCIKGYYNEYALTYLLDTLKDLNKEWDEKIQNDPLINDDKLSNWRF